MKYYSEILGRTFTTEKDCLTAEAEYEAKQAQARKEREAAQAKERAIKEQQAAERKQAAAEVDAAFKTLQKARSEYSQKLSDFCKKYGYYHQTLKQNDSVVPTLFDIFDLL